MQVYPWMYAFDNINNSWCFRCSSCTHGTAYLSLSGLRLRSIVFSLYLVHCQRARILIFIHGYADDLQIHGHYLAHKISQLTKCLTHFIHVVNHLILSNLAKVWSRGTFDPIVINGKTISHTFRDLGVYIDSSINLADHVPRLTTRTCFFKFINLDLSIRCSLSNFRTPCAMVRTSLDYCNGLLGGKPCEVSHQSVIWRVRKSTVPHWLDNGHLCKNAVQDLRACSPMPSRICSTLSDTSRQ